MSEKIASNEEIKEFINDHLDPNDFGYLVICSDPILNDEALSKIREDFKKFINNEDLNQ